MKLKNNNINKQPVVALLKQEGVSHVVAEQLVREFSPQSIQTQIKCLPFRNPKDNPAGLLVKSIRENWEIPAEYQQHLREQFTHQQAKEKQALENQQQQDKAEQIELIKAQLTEAELKALQSQAKQQVAHILRAKYGDKIPQILIDSIMNHLIRIKYLKKRDEPRTSEEKK